MRKHFFASATLLLITCLLFTLAVKGQRFIDKRYDKVLSGLKKYNPGNDSTSVRFLNADKTIRMEVGGKGSQPATFEYFFDLNNKCISEKTTASCDSCYKKYLNDLLDKKKYGWIRLNENQYISAYKWKLMIELPVKEEKQLFYHLIKVTWNKETYSMLLEGAEQ